MQTLETKLNDANLLEETSSDTVALRERSLFILFFHGLGGALSSLFSLSLIFLMFGGSLDEPEVLVVIGLVLIAIAYIVLRKNSSDFLEYFALVLVVTGEFCIFMAMKEFFEPSHSMIAFFSILVYIVLFFLIDITLHRFYASFMILLKSFYLLIPYGIEFLYIDLLALLMLGIWLNEYKSIKYLEQIQVFAYALVTFLLLTMNDMTRMYVDNWGMDILKVTEKTLVLPTYVCTLTEYIFATLMMGMLLSKFGLGIKDRLFMALIFATLVFYFVQPLGLNLSLLFFILLLAFYGQNLPLMVLGLFGMIQSIFSFYALSSIDFLTKSKALFIFGGIMLIFAFVLHLYLSKKEQLGKGVKHA